jgi:acetoin utilization protein AcuB
MLTVKQLMTLDPDTVTPNSTLHRVIAIMNKDGCRQLPVVEQGKLVGIITDRDVRLAVRSPALEDKHLKHHAERAQLLDELTVASCMAAEPITVTPDRPAHEAADILSIHKFGALPVVENGVLVGIVTVTDFLKYMAAHGV